MLRMENPAIWSQVQKAIAEALTEHAEDVQAGICGLSEVSRVYTKLCKQGFLKPEFCESVDSN